MQQFLLFPKMGFSRRLLAAALVWALALAPAPVSVLAQEAVPEAASSPSPTPDPHTEAYYQEPDSNAYEGWPAGPLIEGSAAVLMDLDTGAILYAKNMDAKRYPASITKLMTGLIACESLDQTQSLTMSEAAAYGIEAGSSSIYGDVGEIFTVEQALMGLMLESANEMALALAEETSGSVKKFVELMNQRARELGCTGTHFNNPNGLPDESHYTTAADMARIARASWINPAFRRYYTTSYYEIPPTNVMKETRYLLNHHKMMPGESYAYDGVQGGKTGYTEAAGNTLVTFAKKGKLSLVAVVMNSVAGAYDDTAALLDYGFGSFEHLNMRVTEQPEISLLPAQETLLRPDASQASFAYKARAVVTVPAGTKRSQVDSSQILRRNAAGRARLETIFTFHNHPVGSGMLYEKENLPDLIP